jgi:hypothetical protein
MFYVVAAVWQCLCLHEAMEDRLITFQKCLFAMSHVITCHEVSSSTYDFEQISASQHDSIGV